MIAMALVHNPDMLIADEPTTALDVTVQAQILELIDRVKKEFDIGVILITHDLGVVADVAQTVMVMYAGRAMELGPTHEVFNAPLHPYTWGLLESIPRVDQKVVDADARSRARRRRSSTSPPGCPFHPRCPHRFAPCDKERPRASRPRRVATRRPATSRATTSARSGPSVRPACGKMAA